MTKLTDYPTPMTASEARDLGQDPLYQKLVNELNKVIEGEKDKMVFAKDEHAMVRCQERVQALRFVSRFTEIIIDREEVEEPAPGKIIKEAE